MKKFIFMIMAVLCSVMTVSAQSQSNYSGSSKFLDNTSVGIVGGVETNLHDWNAPQGAVAGILLNKEITPIFGVTLEGNTNINGLRNWASDASHICSNTFDGLSVYLTPRVNLTNAILGYKGSPRKFEIEAVAGPGYGFLLHDEYNALLVKAGLNFNYNVSKAFTVMLRPAVVYNLSANDAQFDSRSAVAQLTAGVVYHFKTSNGTRSFNKAKLYNQSEVDVLNAKIADLQSNLEAANKAVKTNTVNTVDTVYAESPSSLGNVVSFKLNSANVDETQMANLDNAVRMLKENPDLKVTLKGYADKNTGSTSYNKRLSVRRAEAVKDIIVSKYGIAADRVDVLGVGDTEQLYSDNNWNRVVIFVENK